MSLLGGLMRSEVRCLQRTPWLWTEGVEYYRITSMKIPERDQRLNKQTLPTYIVHYLSSAGVQTCMHWKHDLPTHSRYFGTVYIFILIGMKGKAFLRCYRELCYFLNPLTVLRVVRTQTGDRWTRWIELNLVIEMKHPALQSTLPSSFPLAVMFAVGPQFTLILWQVGNCALNYHWWLFLAPFICLLTLRYRFFFNGCVILHCENYHIFFYHSSAEGHLSCLQFLAVMNRVVMTMVEQVSLKWGDAHFG